MRVALLAAALAAPGPMVPDRPAVETEVWPRLAAHYAFVQVTTAVSDAPFLGEVTTETQALGTLRVEQRGRTIRLTDERLCALSTSSPTPFVHTRYPKAFLTAMSGGSRMARLETGTAGRVRMIQPRSTEVRGAKLGGVDEPLPVEPEDPRVIDPDGDGHPGLTVRVEGLARGELHLVTRGWTRFDAELRADGTLSGPLAWSTEQQVLGVTHWMLKDPPASRPHPDPDRSWYGLVPLPTPLPCAQVAARAEALRTRAEPSAPNEP